MSTEDDAMPPVNTDEGTITMPPASDQAPEGAPRPRVALFDLPISTVTPVTAADAAVVAQVSSDDRILVNVPKGFTLTLDNGHPCPINPGTQMLARTLANHWYAKANGVTPFDETT